MDKYQNKYRISSHRKPNWNYSADALYFLTIVTQNRKCNLGKILKTESLDSLGNMYQHSEIILSDYGKIVELEWFKSFEIRNELILHKFVIMPNHLHAIVEIYIGNRDETIQHETVRNETINDETAVETYGCVSLPIKIKRNPPIRLPKSISSFIAGFKSAINTKIDDYIDAYHLDLPKYNRKNHFFQPNYHDHIIRIHREYKTISNYIANNPEKWNNDTIHV